MYSVTDCHRFCQGSLYKLPAENYRPIGFVRMLRDAYQSSLLAKAERPRIRPIYCEGINVLPNGMVGIKAEG